MTDINYILKDDSKNDYQLVKELSIFIKNWNKKNLPVNKEFVIGALNIVLRNSEVNCETIRISSSVKSYAYYNHVKREIGINVSKLINDAKKVNVGLFNFDEDDIKIIVYFSFIHSIIHEITHARQEYLVATEKNPIYDSCFTLQREKPETYISNYKEILIERYAELRGYSIAFQVLSYIYPIEIINIFQFTLCFVLLNGYKVKENGEIISAIESYNSLVDRVENKVNIDSNIDMPLYSRLYLGLPISQEEYEKVKDLPFAFAKRSAPKVEVKKLINKM